MEDPSSEANANSADVCGGCGQPINCSEAAPVSCAHCGAQFLVPEGTEPQQVDPAEATGDLQDELSGLRIRQIAALRRSADRARSYCLIGLVVLAVGAGQFLFMTLHDAHSGGWHLLQTGYSLAAILGFIFAWRLARRSIKLTRELRQPLQIDPLAPPDFSTLSDGSQQVKNLEQM